MEIDSTNEKKSPFLYKDPTTGEVAETPPKTKEELEIDKLSVNKKHIAYLRYQEDFAIGELDCAIVIDGDSRFDCFNKFKDLLLSDDELNEVLDIDASYIFIQNDDDAEEYTLFSLSSFIESTITRIEKNTTINISEFKRTYEILKQGVLE